MILTSPIHIRTKWMPKQGVFIWAECDDEDFYPYSIKSTLFAWHSPSFFGALIKEHQLDGQEGVLLPPYLALEYLSAPVSLEHAEIAWSDEAHILRRTATWLWNEIYEGRILPVRLHFDEDAEQKSGWSWCLTNPPAEPLPYLDDWFAAVMRDLSGRVDTLPFIQEAWLQVLVEHPTVRQSVPISNLQTDEDWLVAIGWKEDHCPFHLGLQLKEPKKDGDWILRPVLQDREKEERIYPVTGDGKPLRPSYPKLWAEHMERMQEGIQALTQHLPFSEGPKGMTLDDEQAWEFLLELGPRLIEAGIKVFLPEWWKDLKKLQPKLTARVASSVGSAAAPLFGLNQIIQFDWQVAIGDMDVSEEEFLKMLKQRKSLVNIQGKWVQLDLSLMEKIQQLVKRAQKQDGLSFQELLETQLTRDPSSAEWGMGIDWGPHLSKVMEQLGQRSTMPPFEPSKELQATLRPYQLQGVSWLLFLRRLGLGSCLADDMGLGKTIQFITYLLDVVEKEQPGSPSLLICPTSVLGNWQKELERFAPSLKVYLHYGSKRIKGDEFAKAVSGADIVLTSYALSHLDEQELTTVSWDSICLDEAQNIKNAYTKQSAAIRRLKGRHRIAMTGTPMENRLTEMWSIFEFINPGYLGSLRQFSEQFVTTIEKTSDPVVIQRVQQLVRPFLLRRLKTDPAIQLDLPEKNESKEFVSLTVEQASLYEMYIQDLFARLETVTPMERRGLIFAALTRLKQLCNHPSLYLKEEIARLGDRALDHGVGQGPVVDIPSSQEDVEGDMEADPMDAIPSGQEDSEDDIGPGSVATIPSDQGGTEGDMGSAPVATIPLSQGGTEGDMGSAPVATIPSSQGGTEGDMGSAPVATIPLSQVSVFRSQKIERLLEMIEDLRNEGEKCLIFTQFAQTGRLLQKVIEDHRQEPVLFLHGRVTKNKRDEMIARFQDDTLPPEEQHAIFILSLKAGGTGLNLTGANHVFHFDRWWNPAIENQATDRAYRIGQTRHVHVHKFITLGTLEERIDEMLERKLGLSEMIVGAGEQWISEMSTDELKDIFTLRKEWIES
ncbi:DEAD/DEAH box helicase [Ammoniphilus resinae]|uniref:SNF2 family DNA or RNA helicase n=1 Tax=Ammoniphilus resinae TaxID=861532 RepID=A0ABS4GQN2_9BACL|nr:DEAD/DEAH box helicase [Ammoniphilus resinae]MBP1932536.1 SNF2 family DNA or RNA helicase [Ammoniphilus resinae]